MKDRWNVDKGAQETFGTRLTDWTTAAERDSMVLLAHLQHFQIEAMRK